MPRDPETIVLVLLLLGLGACTSPAGEQPSIRSRTAVTTAAEEDTSSFGWPYWPQSMRIYPLSRLVTDRSSGDLVIEVRVEFFDAEGHTCKGVGQILVDLLDAGSLHQAEPIKTWVADLANLQDNRDHFDDLTLTYLFRLECDATLLPDQPQVRVYFHSADGQHLQTKPYLLKKKR